MVKEEIWSISSDRARAFFREQRDIAETPEGFRFGSCRITLTQLPPKDMGIWTSRRISLRLEGDEADISAIYHRFLIQFLTAGG